MDDVASIEAELDALERALESARHDAAMGHGTPDLAALFVQHEAAVHPEAGAMLVDRAAPVRLRALHLGLRVEQAQGKLETRLLAAEAAARAGPRSLREARSRLGAEPDRGLRARMESEWLAAEGDLLSLRADRLELAREAASRLGVADERGAALASSAAAALSASADAHAEVLEWAARKYAGDAPPPDGDLSAADVFWLRRGQAEGSAFAAGAVRLTALDLCDAMALALRGRGVRLDLERRPDKEAGPHAARVGERSVAAAALPAGTPRDVADALEALGRAAILAAGPPPGFDPALPLAMGMLLSRAVLEPSFHLRVLRATAAETDRAVRLLALGEVSLVREACARLLGERELATGGTSRPRLGAFATMLADARGAATDEREVLALAGLPGSAAQALAARSLGGLLAAELVRRFDEDWFRNPRTGPFLAELLDPMRTAEAIAGELGGAIDPAAALARPLALLG